MPPPPFLIRLAPLAPVAQATAANKKADNKTLQQAQINDLQQYADLAEKGKVAFKEYTPLLLEDQERAIADENAPEKTTAKTANSSRTAQIPLPAEPIYYYHPDHLGTSTFLTDANGNAYQFFLNLPFGETMAEQLGTSYYKSPYKFNGKELDEETGLYYYGARYYNPKTSLWLSVDPLAELGPEYSPYCYTFNNPTNLTDPDGRWPYPSWSSIKNHIKSAIQYDKMKSDWKNIKSTVYNGKGWNDVVKDVKRTGRDIQKWTKDNKKEILATAKGIQDIGDTMVIGGGIAAVAGAPVAGVGAAPGAAWAGAGEVVGLFGSGIEIATKLITEDTKGATEAAKNEAGWFTAGKVANVFIDRAIPGTTPDISKEAGEVIKNGAELLKATVGSAMTTTKRGMEKKETTKSE